MRVSRAVEGTGNSTKRGAQATIQNSSSTRGTDQRIDSLRMQEGERHAAKAHMRDADVLAELFYRAVENLRSGRQSLAHLFIRRAR